MTTKAEIRARMRDVRKQARADNPDAPRMLAAHAQSLIAAVSGTAVRRPTVALYAAMGSEIDPGPLAEALTRLGCDLCLPVAVAHDAALIFRAWSPGDALSPDAAGCPAPLGTASEIEPDLILCPLLAFDASGARLGQGGGYYDRTLAAVRPEVARVGLAWSAQEIDRLPVEPHDARLDGVLTELGYRPFP